ncbi:hypothetical protein BDZ89DRAFT_1163546 [Hymenopellis radicata]|nr:hypothetical protein BDZ89DRAFT_1163546 [Hymenopellis radicata]
MTLKDTSILSGFPSPLGVSGCLGFFEKSRLLDAHEKPVWKDRSFYVRESLTRPILSAVEPAASSPSNPRRAKNLCATMHGARHPYLRIPKVKDTQTHSNSAKVLASLTAVTPSGLLQTHVSFSTPFKRLYLNFPRHTRTPLFIKPGPHQSTSAAHNAAYTLPVAVDRPEFSIGNIMFAQEPDGTSTGLLVDWDLARCDDDDKRRAYSRMGTTQHFMAARLCSPSPPPRTVGDDVESFVLLLLWMAARYAPNNMTPSDRGAFLARFDRPSGLDKMDIIRGGTDTVVDLKLLSSGLGEVLEDILNVYCSRYKGLTSREKKKPEVVEELERRQALLERHDWLVDILRMTLQNEAWANDTDGSRKEQTVERPSRVRTIGVDWF